jgi:hypothetical protein
MLNTLSWRKYSSSSLALACAMGEETMEVILMKTISSAILVGEI